MFRRACGPALWAGVVDFANEVYSAIKDERPSATVFPSFQAGFLRGQENDQALTLTPNPNPNPSPYANPNPNPLP